MKKTILTICAVVSALAVHAEIGMNAHAAGKIKMAKMRGYGGDIIDKREMKGVLAFVNAQKLITQDVIEDSARLLADDFHVETALTNGVFEMTNPSLAGTVTVFIIEDEKLPMSMVAPEARWGFVNAAQLKSEKEAFSKARLSKEIYRTTGLLLGAASTKFDHCIFQGITSPEGLDEIIEIKTPLEYRERFEKYMPSIGLKPYKLVQYRKACMEGWAPQPTNEYQQAIWDKIHEMPSEPIQIKPETKKVTE